MTWRVVGREPIKTSSEIVNTFQVRSKFMVHYSSKTQLPFAKHLLLQRTNPNPTLFFKCFDLTLLSLHPPHHHQHQRVPINLNLKDMGMKRHQFCNMIGCINGIICFGDYFINGFHGFVLWNPAIKKRKTVHYPILPDWGFLDQTTCCRTTVKNSQATTIWKEWRASSAWWPLHPQCIVTV